MRVHEASGREHLQLVTALLQRARAADPEAGEWEAGDFQWWWRKDQHRDPANATYWLDDDDQPVGAVVFSDWTDAWACDVLAMPGAGSLDADELWPHALRRMAEVAPRPIDVAVRDGDALAASVLTRAGFDVVAPSYMTCWMPVADRRPTPSIPSGYRLVSRAERGDLPHHMIARNGPHVAERLHGCSLYRPELDLCIESHDGGVAAYGLFWADPVTGVGLVEPMRTEDAHQGKGLARHLLGVGLDLLADHGCTRLKVTYQEGNEPARLLYLGSGFRPRTRCHTYRLHEPPQS